MRDSKLKLPANTRVIIDETKLDEGKLTEVGFKNFSALQKLVSEQTVEYNFTVYSKEFHVNYPTLIISKSKSILAVIFWNRAFFNIN